MGENLRDRPRLDYLTTFQHHQPVGPFGGHGQIVGDEQHRGPTRGDSFRQPVEDLAGHGGVQGAGRFVGDHQFRTAGQRDRDQHALSLPAGQFVRVLARSLSGPVQPHFLEQIQGPQPCGALVGEVVHEQGLRHLVAHAQNGIQGQSGILWNEAHTSPA